MSSFCSTNHPARQSALNHYHQTTWHICGNCYYSDKFALSNGRNGMSGGKIACLDTTHRNLTMIDKESATL